MEPINVAELLEKNKALITEKLVKDFANDVAHSLSYTLEQEIRKFAGEYIQVNVLPEVQKHLEANKDELVKTMLAAVKTGTDMLGEALIDQIKKNMSSQWKVTEIAKKLIGDSY